LVPLVPAEPVAPVAPFAPTAPVEPVAPVAPHDTTFQLRAQAGAVFTFIVVWSTNPFLAHA
jgi:hypothetical protein